MDTRLQKQSAELMYNYAQKLAQISADTHRKRQRAQDIRTKLDNLDEAGDLPGHMRSEWQRLKADGQQAEQKAADMLEQWIREHGRFGRNQAESNQSQ